MVPLGLFGHRRPIPSVVPDGFFNQQGGVMSGRSRARSNRLPPAGMTAYRSRDNGLTFLPSEVKILATGPRQDTSVHDGFMGRP